MSKMNEPPDAVSELFPPMSRTVRATYDAAAKVLRLHEPLEGIAHGTRVWITDIQTLEPSPEEQSSD